VRLYRRLLTMLSGLSPRGASPHRCSGPRLLSCMARGEPACHSLLVALTGTQPISAHLAALMRDWQRARPHRSTVLPFLPPGALPSHVLPSPLDRLIALFTAGGA